MKDAPLLDRRPWWTDTDNVLVLAHQLLDAGIMDDEDTRGVLYLFEKPWKWSQAWHLWQALGTPTADESVPDDRHGTAWLAWVALYGVVESCAHCGGELGDGPLVLAVPGRAISIGHLGCVTDYLHDTAADRAVPAAVEW